MRVVNVDRKEIEGTSLSLGKAHDIDLFRILTEAVYLLFDVRTDVRNSPRNGSIRCGEAQLAVPVTDDVTHLTKILIPS
jgi:hypothetical protein